jgi:hypothetical protein
MIRSCLRPLNAGRVNCVLQQQFEFHGSAMACMGRPFRRRNGREVIHASEKPPEIQEIDFNAIGLKYPLTVEQPKTIGDHYWSPRPETRPDHLPFFVERSHPGDALPVYTDLVSSGTRVITILRKIKGDIGELQSEVEKVVGKEVALRPGKIVIEGRYKRRIQMWLTGLGF